MTDTDSSLIDSVAASLRRGFGIDDTSGETTMPEQTESGWATAESSAKKTLHGVVQTVAGPFAVGTGGIVLRRTDGGWETVIPAGPATKRNTLTCVDVTDDGERIWFAGSSGALGVYDTQTGRKYDYSAPDEKTSTWEAIAIRGEVGEEQLLIANGSGEVLSATIDAEGCPTFGEVVKPGSGSTISGLDFGDQTAYAIDTSGNVFAKDATGSTDSDGPTDGDESADTAGSDALAGDGGTDATVADTSEWRDIGIRNAQVNFHDIAASSRRLLVSAGGGLVYRYDRACRNWTPVQAGTGPLLGIDGDESTVVAVGAGGEIVERPGDTGGWRSLESPTGSKLTAVSVGDPDVAIGESGTIVERGSGQ
ncbi:hypothetical protein ACOZ4N_07175 [Halorientalis pallida]|uniref:hypothetical protein n=1 Tax=Halorientalis pallida TaxID=2479928 RepID=UPI003C6FD6D4